MSPMQNDKVIEKLKKQVARAESKGNFNSAHHRVLARYLKARKPVERVTARNAKRGAMEEPTNGE